jgi:hypothetical protein
MTEDGPRTPPPTESGVKPEGSSKTKVINLKIKDQQEVETIFKIKATTKLSKVFESYTRRHSIDPRSIRFMFNGTRVQNHDTPESLEMEDGEEIQAMVEQQGGVGTPAANEPKGDQDGSTYLTVKVVDQSQNQMFFKIKDNKPLKKMMDAYCKAQGITRDSVRFVVEGERLVDGDTPLSREMEDQDTIEVFGTQLGGGDGDVDEAPGNGDDQLKDEGANARINIKLVDQNHHEVTYKVSFPQRWRR